MFRSLRCDVVLPQVRVTPMRTEIIIRATRTQNVLGEKGRRIRELTSLVQKRFKFAEGSVELYAEKVSANAHKPWPGLHSWACTLSGSRSGGGEARLPRE